MERMQNMQQRGYGRRYSNPYYNQNTRQNVSARSGNGNSCNENTACGYNTTTAAQNSNGNSGCNSNCNSNNSCANEYGDTKTFNQFQLAMAYVPWQSFGTTYSLCEALQVGTIFPELDFPFEKARCQRR